MSHPACPEIRRDAQRSDPECTGQATVEFALTLPLVAMTVALVVQICVIGLAHLRVVRDASVAARVAAVAADPQSAARRWVDADSQLEVIIDGDIVSVTVTRDVETRVPLIGRVLPTVHLRADLSMPLEPPLH